MTAALDGTGRPSDGLDRGDRPSRGAVGGQGGPSDQERRTASAAASSGGQAGARASRHGSSVAEPATSGECLDGPRRRPRGPGADRHHRSWRPPRSRDTLARERCPEDPDDQHRRRVALPVHVRVRHRGPSRQALRPGLGRDPRRLHPGRSRGRVACESATTRARDGPRRDLHEGRLRRRPDDRPRDRPGHRLHEGRVRLRLPDLRHARLDQGAVVGHRPGRRRGARGPGRRRAGPRARAPATRG